MQKEEKEIKPIKFKESSLGKELICILAREYKAHYYDTIGISIPASIREKLLRTENCRKAYFRLCNEESIDPLQKTKWTDAIVACIWTIEYDAINNCLLDWWVFVNYGDLRQHGPFDNWLKQLGFTGYSKETEEWEKPDEVVDNYCSPDCSGFDILFKS